jgi:hypothetical protein
MLLNRFKSLSTEDLIELLVLSTNELLAAIDAKKSAIEINAKRKELQLIQAAILERKPQAQIQE